MKSFWRLLTYIKNYRLHFTLAITSNVLTALFTVVSIPILIPFLEILFDRREGVFDKPQIQIGDLSSLEQYFNYYLTQLIQTQGKESALTFVCTAIVIIFFLKNLFRYFSMFFMAPLRNGIVRDLRAQLFDKVLALPLSFFSEEKKGDVISRMTADVHEVQWSILNVLEAIFREPIIIAGALALMIYISPPLTLFVFALIIFTAFVIGGIGKSLRRPSGDVQNRLGALLSIIEEGLSGLRIIKGFNAEGYQETKFGVKISRLHYLNF